MAPSLPRGPGFDANGWTSQAFSSGEGVSAREAGYPAGDRADRALYWLGKVLAQASGDAAGVPYLRESARHETYYGYRAIYGG